MKILILLVFAALFVSDTSLSQGSNEWVHTKGPPGFFPISSATLSDQSLVVSNLSGLFRTTNSGSTWTEIEPPSGGLQNGLLCTTSNGSLLIGSNGDYRDGAYPAPIYKSTDFGISWSSSPLDYTCRVLASISPKLIYAVAKQKYDYGYSVIFSTNNGDSWVRTEKVVSFENSLSDADVSFDRDGKIYIRDFDTVTWKRIVTVSSDTGKTWQYLAYKNNIDSSDKYGYASYTATRGKGDVLFLTYSGMPYISHDKGIHWSVIERLRHFSDGSSAPRFVGDLEGNVLLITNSGPILTTTDNGLTWDSSFCYSYPGTRVKGDNNGSFYFYTEFGLYSYNVHDKKVVYSGVSNSTPKHVGVLSNSELIAYNSIVDEYQGTDYSYYGLLSQSTDNHQSWNPVLSHSYEYSNWDYISDLVLDSNQGIIITTHDFGRVLRSTDIGKTWSSLYAKSSYSKANISLYVSPNGSLYAYSPTFGIKATNNNGINWTSYVYKDRSTNDSRTDGFNSILESSFGITFAGVYNNLYKKSINDSAFVDLANITLTDKVRFLYETSLGDIYVVSEDNHVFLSSDGGDTFILAQSGLPYIFTTLKYSAICEIGNGVVVIAVGNQMYYRRNFDSTWKRFPAPEDITDVVSLTYNKSQGLFVGCKNAGLWLCKNISDTITSNVEVSQVGDFSAFVYPNPLTSTSSILVKSNTVTKVSISVFDILGRSIVQSRIYSTTPPLLIVSLSDLVESPLCHSGQYYINISSILGRRTIPITIEK